nr:hypothetical protein [Planctomycetota bacterium]
MGDDFADDLKRFITERIDSIELLEVLLAMRAERDRPHGAEALARTLGSNASSIRVRLRALEALAIAQAEGTDWR